jgi:hypothetical protein
MNVDVEEYETIFSNLKAGDVFTYAGLPYMKTDNLDWPAIELGTGGLIPANLNNENNLVKPAHKVTLYKDQS